MDSYRSWDLPISLITCKFVRRTWFPAVNWEWFQLPPSHTRISKLYEWFSHTKNVSLESRFWRNESLRARWLLHDTVSVNKNRLLPSRYCVVQSLEPFDLIMYCDNLLMQTRWIASLFVVTKIDKRVNVWDLTGCPWRSETLSLFFPTEIWRLTIYDVD